MSFRKTFLIRCGAALLAAAITAPMALAAASLPSWAALAGRRVLLVTGAAAVAPNDDALVRAHLEARGLRVATTTDAAIAAAKVTPTADLVLISSTADPAVLGRRFAAAGVPVFTWNTMDYPQLGLTGPRLHRDYDVIEPTQHFAESFAVLYGYGANVTSSISRAAGLKAQLFGTLYLEPATVGWGRPGPGGRVLVDFDGTPREAGVFTYERGATLADGAVAPARRVGFYLSNANFHLLTAVHGPAARDPNLRDWYRGLDLFDASIRWALAVPPPRPHWDPEALARRFAAAARGKKLLFVERMDAGEGREADRLIVEHLRAVGFDVVVADQMDPESRSKGMDAVMISSTCSKYKLANKYAGVPVPVISLEGLMADMLHMAGRHRYVDYGEHGEEKESEDPPTRYLDIVAAWSPMAAGLPAGPVAFTQEPSVLKWAHPLPDAVVIATLPGSPDERAIFGYPAGATMTDGFVAPARRVLLPLDNPSYEDMTPQGKALFDAATLWAISGPRR
ncbi:MAG: hypothetical protein KGL34_12055 [Gammaproteobacteria bacterium]|nr:hypothetical protein [Gammaproteobacteria bacterium]